MKISPLQTASFREDPSVELEGPDSSLQSSTDIGKLWTDRRRFNRDIDIPLQPAKRRRRRRRQQQHQQPRRSSASTDLAQICLTTGSPGFHGSPGSQNSSALQGDLPSLMNRSHFPCQASGLLFSRFISSSMSQRLASLRQNEANVVFNTEGLYQIDSASLDLVNGSQRDEEVRKLLYLHKAYFDLEPGTLVQSISFVDEFISRVRVKPKYTRCLTTAAYFLSCELLEPENRRPSMEELVSLTQCGGNQTDLSRMVAILRSKLNRLDTTNALHYLGLLHELLADQAGEQLATTDGDFRGAWKHAELRILNRVLYALCHFSVRRFSPACLALSAVCQEQAVMDLPCVYEALGAFSAVCQVSSDEVLQCSQIVETIFQDSRKPGFPVCCEQLSWTLSRRTKNDLTSLKRARMRLSSSCEVIPESPQLVIF